MMDGPIVASLPASSLDSLADLRRESGLRVLLEGDRAWLRWDGGDPSFAHRLMALPEVEIFRKGEDGHWRGPGRRLPAFDLPTHNPGFTTLVHAIAPLPFEPVAPPPAGPTPHQLTLVRDGQERPATTLLCDLNALAPWVDSATSAEFEAISVALCGTTALLRGKAAMLPTIVSGTRFWGARLLTPLGWRPDPDLPERALLRSLGGEGDDVILIQPPGTFEAIPLDSFAPWSRASARLAIAAAAGGHARP